MNRGRIFSCLCFAIAILCILSTSAFAADDAAGKAMQSIHPEAIRADMRFLSDDLLEGRGTGSRGYEIAAKFLATQFEGLGLKAAGENGTFLQTVPFHSMKADASRSTFTLNRGGKEENLVFAQDFLLHGDAGRSEVTVEAPIVFAGFGVTAPEQNYDDYKGIDAHGKIVALILAAPNFPSSIRAHYSSREMKARTAVEHGAVGIIILDDLILEKIYSFSERVRDLAFPQLNWLDKQGHPNDYFPELKCSISLSLDATRKFFEGTAHNADEIFAAAKDGKSFSFDMPMTAKAVTVTNSTNISSPNVAAVLEGSDPVLKNEYVVYNAHLDHLGVGEAVKGDKIYNGALDNASGSATLVELARAFSQMNPRPKRSILFVAVTGEEAGLLGSDYFAHYPTVAKKSIVANINVDEVLLLWPMEDVIAFGAEHSSLGDVIKKAAARMNVTVSPDPLPEQVIFIRSDQYSFVKQGIPAVMPSAGFKSLDPKVEPFKIFGIWEETRYHQPQDDMDQPWLDFEAAAKFARFAFLCGYLITEDPQRPTWNKGDFFGDKYGGVN
jgi:Peptidase family M28